MKQRLLQSLLLLCGLIVGSVAWADTVTYGWEDDDDASKWIITDAIAKTSDQGKTGTNAGKINTNHTYVQFKEKVKVTSFSFALKRTSNNSNYNVYIETSTDGKEWTAVETYKMSDFGNGSYTQKSKLFDGTTEYYVRFHCYNTTAVRYVDDVSITYSAGNEPPTCITPTFSPAAGTFASAQNVTISSETDGATIYYTVDGTEPTTESNVYSRAIPVNETTTIKAFAAKADYSNSAVASATYTIIALNHAGTAEDPYTVADALSAVDAGVGITGVYATGIVSKIVTAFNASYGNITYNISVDGKVDSDQLQAFRGKSKDGAEFTSEDDVKVGDIVVVYGNLTKYNSTYEFEADNQLYSLERPVVTSPTLTVSKTSLTGFTYAEGCGPSAPQTFDLTGENLTGNVTLTLDNENFEISVSETNDYATSLIRPKSEFGSKTIYVRLKAGLDVNETYSGTITISSDGAEDKTVTLDGNVTVYVPDYATLPFAFNDGKAKIESTVGLTQSGLGSDYNSTNAPTTQLKFDTTGDYMILKLNEAAGTLAFDIKGNSFSNSTFTVQTSSDGLSYRNLMVYTELEGTQTVALALAPDVRFIKWIYTEKASGNVGLGNIKVVDWAEIVSVNEARYATYVPKHDVIFPDGVEAYIGTINKKYVSLTAVKSAPKDTPVILKNTGRYTLIPVTEETIDDVTGNDLSASDKDVEATGSQYILAKPDGEEVGFYKATGTIPAGKAYLVSNETGPLVKAFYFVGEGETAIGSIQNSNFEIQNGEVYNLAGQRISKMQKGVNIINGYKVLR